ncbi:MAG: hypothetical protein GY942_19435 [Aestuariibacter sp.]|nr:hypothetical protein [Halieaceae bacterium]MCP5012156.1 hypothetical protein [Aestuariibacter sp.]
MKKKALAVAVACSFSFSSKRDEKNLIWLQATPTGSFRSPDGRPSEVAGWYIDEAVASKIIARFAAATKRRVVDYEHQTLYKEKNGAPAPAAGWFKDMEWRDGEGLFIQVELTTRAASYIDDEEYIYFSPVMLYHPKTGEVLDIRMGALTNDPALEGLQELSLRAAATFGIELDEEEPPMNKLLIAICAALGLPESTTEDEAAAALSTQLSGMRSALGADENASGEVLLAACTALKAKAAAKPDAGMVSVSVVEDLKGEISALSARLKERDEKDVDSLIQAALDDGRLIKPMEAWARDLAKTNLTALSSYLDNAAPIAALAGSQSKGASPESDDKTELTEAELAVCSSMGITSEQFIAAKEA